MGQTEKSELVVIEFVSRQGADCKRVPFAIALASDHNLGVWVRQDFSGIANLGKVVGSVCDNFHRLVLNALEGEAEIPKVGSWRAFFERLLSSPYSSIQVGASSAEIPSEMGLVAVNQVLRGMEEQLRAAFPKAKSQDLPAGSFVFGPMHTQGGEGRVSGGINFCGDLIPV